MAERKKTKDNNLKKKVNPKEIIAMAAMGPVYGTIRDSVELGGKFISEIKKKGILSREVFFSDSFDPPSVVRIVDDAEKRDDKDFEGAVGWISKQNKMEVLNLFDTIADKCYLSFDPVPTIGSFYYVDPHFKNCFISFESLFSKIQKQKTAELDNIAYCLGAKRYEIEIIEEISENTRSKKKVDTGATVKVVDVDAGFENAKENDDKKVISCHVTGEYKTKRKPQVPELLWFKNDNNINNLIKHICVDKSRIKSKKVEFEGAEYSTLNEETAARLDATVKKLGGKNKAQLQKQARKEMKSIICFYMEF